MNSSMQRLTPNGHQHAEAFCLMWYRCPCGHMERIWNSRDGVTPFGTACPSCGKPDLCHAYFGSDEYAPNHTPASGQRVWVTMTKDRATQLAKRRIEMLRKHRRLEGRDEEAIFNSLFESFYQDGAAPDLVVTGYAEVQS